MNIILFKENQNEYFGEIGSVTSERTLRDFLNSWRKLKLKDGSNKLQKPFPFTIRKGKWSLSCGTTTNLHFIHNLREVRTLNRNLPICVLLRTLVPFTLQRPGGTEVGVRQLLFT